MTTRSVLIVDDDNANNFISQKVLETTGMFNCIHTAENGKDALEFLSEHCSISGDNMCPGIIFLDLNMPVMDGISFLKTLQTYEAKGRSFRVFILTNSDDPKDLTVAKKYNIEGYISKPLSEEIVMEILE